MELPLEFQGLCAGNTKAQVMIFILSIIWVCVLFAGWIW